MSSVVTPTVIFADIVGDVGWLGPIAGVVGLGVLALMIWQFGRIRRQYAEDLAEQLQEVSDAQEQARQAAQEKEAVARESQAKSEMLATLSREIRANLNGIIGSADLMMDGALKPSQREHLITLRASAESLHQSLNDVLDYSRLETGQIQIARATFDVRQPLIEVVESLSPLALLKDLELVLIVAADVPLHVTGDAARLRQILLNLMSNAVKFTASGRVVLRVETTPGAASGSKAGGTWLHFSVSDTGAGIPEELQSTIFDRSAPSDALSPRKFGSSGLQLVISKRLVDLMGGQIGARSLPEGGSEFWVALALPADPSQPPAPPPPEGLHVVVLDDLAASRVAVSAMLSRIGIDQDATDTVAKAERLLRDAADAGAKELVLLLDHSVARDSGDALARLVEPESAVRSTRIVLMAHNPDDVRLNTPKFPVAAVVRKPLLRVEVLLEALRMPAGTRILPPSASRTPFEAGDEARPERRGPRVLVVDDDAISRSISLQLLQRLGCVVELALSGAEAIDLARRIHFDVVFMDCQMPEMDGFTATERIRIAAGGKAPPIVALTANSSDADRQRCFAAGMCDFIGKPVRQAELARVVKRWAPAPRAVAN
ncbi:MAG: response regulator [Opitutaceae bacterium]|nr:response regulator [Opitutaceae bacterium]